MARSWRRCSVNCIRGGARALNSGLDPFAPDATAELLRLFAARDWADADPRGPRPRLNVAGAYLVEGGSKLGAVLSYWPMFRQMDTLLFGNAASVFERDSEGGERRLDRRLNIFGSTAQHGIFFREMEDAVVDCFDGLPPDEQPTYIADLGCGDGTLLKRLHVAVASRSRRCPVMDRHPLTLIAADYNTAFLDEARRNLADLPHLTVRAGIGDPSRFIAELAAKGVEPNRVLHVRSSLAPSGRGPRPTASGGALRSTRDGPPAASRGRSAAFRRLPRLFWPAFG
jgi:hypothetical protein